MALIKRQKPKDSIKKFEMSARHKYQAGLTLISGGDATTGIEQLGYSAEMLLKGAYFRFVRTHIGLRRITSTITGYMLRDAAREGTRLHIRYDPESYHSLLFWGLLLAAIRKDHARPLPPETEGELLPRVRELHRLWMIEHRYQNRTYGSTDIARMDINVTWLIEHYEQLWR